MILADHLNQDYGGFRALSDVSFEIPKGQIVGLVGPNGAGKTTTMKILTGYLAPTSGRAVIDGHDIVEQRLEAQRLIGYLPESAPLYREMAVQDYLNYMARLREIPAPDRLRRLSEAVHACGLEERLTQTIGTLSKGYRQRVGLAQAMIHDPRILILDEPTSGLDPTQIMGIRNLIQRLGEEKTVILSTHILSEVLATCDRVLMIVGGKVHYDEPMESFRRGHGIIVRLQGAPDGAALALEGIEGVNAVEAVSDARNNAAFRLSTDSREGLLESIGSLASQKAWVVTELAREHHDLEDIFRELEGDKVGSGKEVVA